MKDVIKKKLDNRNSVSRQDDLFLADKLVRLQWEKENVDQIDSQMWIAV